MKNVLLLWVFLTASILMHCDTYAQEKVNLDFLFDEWVISDKESSINQLILRKPGYTETLSKEDLKTIYSFQIGVDTIVCINHIKNYDVFCLSPPIRPVKERPEKEVWSLNYDGKVLTRGYYYENDTSPIYASIYKIISLNDNYLKLQLLDEVFN
jgi:hypothetical protein